MKIHVGIITPHLQQAKAFYADTLGCQVLVEIDWYLLVQGPGGAGAELAFMLPELAEQHPAFRTATDGKGMWLTLEVADVDTLYAQLQTHGITLLTDVRDEVWGDRHFVLRDPLGLVVDIVRERQPELV